MILAIKLGVSAIVFVACFFWRHAVMVKQTAGASDANDKEIQKQYKKKKKTAVLGYGHIGLVFRQHDHFTDQRWIWKCGNRI